MTYETLLTRLRGLRVETGSLPCLGCGYEHGCSIHGCAILREAVETMEALYARVRQDACCEDCAHVSALEHCPEDWCPCEACSVPDCYCRDCQGGSKWEWRGRGKETYGTDVE